VIRSKYKYFRQALLVLCLCAHSNGINLRKSLKGKKHQISYDFHKNTGREPYKDSSIDIQIETQRVFLTLTTGNLPTSLCELSVRNYVPLVPSLPGIF
jgi:hypothetical protein